MINSNLRILILTVAIPLGLLAEAYRAEPALAKMALFQIDCPDCAETPLARC